MKKNVKKYAGVLLASSVVIGGIATAAITPIPTISNTFAVAGQTITAASINKLAEAINIINLRTNGSQDFDFGTKKGINLADPVANTDAVNKQAMDAAIATALANYVPTPCGTSGGTAITFHGLEYKTIVSCATGKKWLDRNIGATQVATSATDATSYGDYFQWGRPMDGHEKSNSATTSTLATSIVPGIAQFILSNGDWTTADTDGSTRQAFWQKTDGTGVCPTGFHVPSEIELTGENLLSTSDAFSKIKLPMAGIRHLSLGTMDYQGAYSILYPSTPSSGINARWLLLDSASSTWRTDPRAYAYPIRCVQ